MSEDVFIGDIMNRHGSSINPDSMGFLRLVNRMVDETALLGTLPGYFFKSHTMTKSTFLRSLLAATVLIGSALLSTVARAAVGDILETNEGNILRFRGLGTPSTFASGLSNPKGIVFDGKGHVYVADA